MLKSGKGRGKQKIYIYSSSNHNCVSGVSQVINIHFFDMSNVQSKQPHDRGREINYLSFKEVKTKLKKNGNNYYP